MAKATELKLSETFYIWAFCIFKMIFKFMSQLISTMAMAQSRRVKKDICSPCSKIAQSDRGKILDLKTMLTRE